MVVVLILRGNGNSDFFKSPLGKPALYDRRSLRALYDSDGNALFLGYLFADEITESAEALKNAVFCLFPAFTVLRSEYREKSEIFVFFVVFFDFFTGVVVFDGTFAIDALCVSL